MWFKPFRIAVGLALISCALLPMAQAGDLADVQIIDRQSGQALTQYSYRGRTYVAGQPGRSYKISLRNNRGERLLAVMSVDGVNVLNGETASPYQGGYVFAPYEVDAIKGWRKNLDQIAQFHFTALPNSYAARTGRPDNVGVIGVALFAEARQYTPPYDGPEYYDDRPDQPRRRKYDNPESDANAATDALGEATEQSQSSAPGASSRAPNAPRKQEQKLGTGHGKKERDQVGTTTFTRKSTEPDEVVSIYYDSRANLIAQGIIPNVRRYRHSEPNPFPNGFVPDP